MANPYKAILKQINRKAQSDEQRTNTTAGQEKQQAYISYMNSKRDLSSALAKSGVTGGGSESAVLGAATGYQRQKNLIADKRASAVSDIRQTAQANRTSALASKAEYDQNEQAKRETRYANTITGYDTIKKADKAIAAARKAGQNWKIPYLRAQRAALKEQAKNSSSGSSGGTGGSATTYTVSNTAKEPEKKRRSRVSPMMRAALANKGK